MDDNTEMKALREHVQVMEVNAKATTNKWLQAQAELQTTKDESSKRVAQLRLILDAFDKKLERFQALIVLMLREQGLHDEAILAFTKRPDCEGLFTIRICDDKDDAFGKAKNETNQALSPDRSQA